jgi:transcriptional regulator
MYQPEIFRETDAAVIDAFLHANPFAILVTTQDGVPQADHLPFLYDAESKILRAHVARANPLWRVRDAATPALVIFSGGDHYVTPNWYPTKQKTHRVVPTWNYEAAHVYGRLAARDDEDFKRALIEALTRRHEEGRAAPWKVADAPQDFIDAQLQAIVGVELAIERIEMKRKLSQNRTPDDFGGVVAGLDAEDDAGRAMARRMERLSRPPE